MQPRFTQTLLKAAKEKGLHTCIETCGYAKWEDLETLIPYVDIFLWDVKESDDRRHLAYTGVSNQKILSNLYQLNAAGGNIILRCPVIPGFHDREDHLFAIAALAEKLSGVRRIDIEPYHPPGKIQKREPWGKICAGAGFVSSRRNRQRMDICRRRENPQAGAESMKHSCRVITAVPDRARGEGIAPGAAAGESAGAWDLPLYGGRRGVWTYLLGLSNAVIISIKMPASLARHFFMIFMERKNNGRKTKTNVLS